MELKVWVQDMQRIVCGVTKHTTAEDVCRALAVATGQMGRFVLVERRGGPLCQRRLRRDEKPLKILEQWGEFASNVHFILLRTDDLRQAKNSPPTPNSSDQRHASVAGGGACNSNVSPPSNSSSKTLFYSSPSSSSSSPFNGDHNKNQRSTAAGTDQRSATSRSKNVLPRAADQFRSNSNYAGVLPSPLIDNNKIFNSIEAATNSNNNQLDAADSHHSNNSTDSLPCHVDANAEALVVERVVHGEELEMKRQFLIAQLSAMQSELDALNDRTGKCDKEILNWHKQIGKQEQMLTQLQQQVAKLDERLAIESTTAAPLSTTAEIHQQSEAVSKSSNIPPIISSSTSNNNFINSTVAAELDALTGTYNRLLASTAEIERLCNEHRHACDVVENDISQRLFDAEKLTLEFDDVLTAELSTEQARLAALEKQLRHVNLQAFLGGGVQYNENLSSVADDEQQNFLADKPVDVEQKAEPVADDDAVEAQFEPPAPPITFAGDHHTQPLAVDGSRLHATAVHSVKKRQQQQPSSTTKMPHPPRVVMLKRNPTRNPEGLWV